MEGPFPAYDGNEPYAFVSYSHADGETVFPDLELLHETGYNIWYDDGIRAGHHWPEAIADRISNCAIFLYFVSGNSTGSTHCQRELHFAVEAEKPMVVVHIDDNPIPSSVKFVLGSQQAIIRNELKQETYAERLRQAVGEQLPGAGSKGDTRCRFDSSKLTVYAVTPFECRADDPDLVDLAETCTDNLNMLLGINNFSTVSSRRVARAFVENDDPKALGEELGARWIIYGTVRRRGDEIEVRTELTDALTGESPWGSRLSVPSDGADRYMNYITRQIEIPVNDHVKKCILTESAAFADDELDVIALCARSGNIMAHYDTRVRARPLLERAMELDPLHPWPKCILAQYLALGVSAGISRDLEADLSRTRTLIEQAVHEGRDNPWVIHHCSFACWNVGDHTLALELARRAYRLSPVIATKEQLVLCLACNGLADEALGEALELDAWIPPGQTRSHHTFRQCYMLMEDWEKALEHAKLVYDWGPDSFNRLVQALILAELDRIDEAKQQLDIVRQTLPRFQLRKALPGLIRTSNNIPQFYRGIEKLIELGIE